MTDNDAFLAAVVAAPADAAPKLVYSDFLDDAGEEFLAKAYRWTVEHGKFPVPSLTQPDRYLWRSDYNPQPECLPGGVWSSLAMSEDLGAGFKRYPSFDAAMRALARALEANPLDEVRFDALIHRIRGHNGVEFALIRDAYSEEARVYHNSWHILDCLRVFDTVRDLAERPDEVEAALWYHDVVYDPRSWDNEVDSAEWASEDLSHAAESCDRIVDMILATKHDKTPNTADQALVVDIDLSILGRSPEAFAAYDRAIAAEYAWVPPERYREGRLKILQGFLRRPAIYHTDAFHERYEDQARENLERAIAELRMSVRFPT